MPQIQPPAGWSLDPVREQQVREWAAKLGASTSADSIGPYSALCDALAEIDRLRAELEQAQQQTATRIATEIRQYCPDHGEADTCRIDCHCEIADEITRLYTAPAAVSGA